MEDQLISFETAKLAKEKGFNLPCVNWYNFSGLLIKGSATKQYPSNDKRFPSYSSPTQSLLQRWLRDSKNINIDIETLAKGNEIIYSYDLVYVLETLHVKSNKSRFSSYEETLEDGLINALKLIKP